jgi:predicted nucleic acid-binding Zn ribbon protein
VVRFCGFVSRCVDGYAWEQRGGGASPKNEERYAKSLVLRPRSDNIQDCFDVFAEQSALFKIFAKLGPTPDEILGFANQYGDLAVFDEDPQKRGDSLWTWREEIAKFRKLVATADQLQARPESRPKHKQAQDIAKFVEPLLFSGAVYLTPAVQNDSIDLVANVFSLTQVLNIQLVMAIVEGKTYHNCDQCGKPFELTPQINRADRIFCSDNCRVKAYQRRRKQAIAMRAKGTALRVIAKKFNTDLQTVKRWVGETPKEK